MSLANDYCKEIAKELGQTAVYIPGADVKPGDIILFKETNILGVPKPLGEFSVRGNLSDLGINLEIESEQDDRLDSYVYASKGSVSVSFEADAQAGTIGEGKLNIGFSKSGSTYLSAVDCKETRFKSIVGLERELAAYQDALDWKYHFIVISVTVASRALIMQSNSNTASLEIDGSVKNLVPSGTVVQDIDASLNLKITKYKEASFIKDWSNNVPVFFTLVRYRKKFPGGWELSVKKLSDLATNLDKAAQEKNPYVLEVIDPLGLV